MGVTDSRASCASIPSVRSHSAHVVLESFDFTELTEPQERDDWQTVEKLLCEGAKRLQDAGADVWLMACNTVHRLSDALEEQLDIPLLHIADAAGQTLSARGIQRVGLLGTRHTMQGEFYGTRLQRLFDIETRVPDEEAQKRIHSLILNELVHGVVSPEGRKTLDQIGEALAAEGSEATLLACTELGLLYDDSETRGEPAGTGMPPIFDTSLLHAAAAVDLALST